MKDLIGLPYYSLNFPRPSYDSIERDNIRNTIEDIFAKGCNIVNIEGDDDMGKTTLLAQFASIYPYNTISVFLNPINDFTFSLDMFLADAVPQLYFYVNNQKLPDEIPCNAELFQTLCYRIIKNIQRKNNTKVYFVIDGLIENEKYENVTKSIVNILPFIEGIFFLFTGKYKYLEKYLSKNTRFIKPYNIALVPFGINETTFYFNDIKTLENRDILDIYKLTKGYPGKLAIIKRKINELGENAKDFLLNIENYEDVFEHDWNRLDLKDQELVLMLAFLAFCKRDYNIDVISEIIGVNVNLIKEKLRDIYFINIEPARINFITQGHKKFFSKKLNNYRGIIEERLIEFLISKKDTIEYYRDLPELLYKKDELTEILDLFAEENVSQVIQSNQSLDVIFNNLDICFKAATKLKRYGDILRYSFQHTILQEIEDLDIWEAEIEALIALNETDNALSIANSCLLKEDRFKLLVLISKKLKENNIKIDETIIQQIRSLYEQINLANYAEKTVDLAADLFYAVPDIAMDLVDKTTSGKKNVKINDWILAKLKLNTMLNEQEKNDDREVTIRFIDSKINNPKLKKITNSFSFLFGDYSVLQVIEELKKIEEEKIRLHLLRIWIDKNYSINDVDLVVDYAIETLISNADKNTINAAILNDFAKPLPYIRSKQKFYYLLAKFDTLKQSALEFGPTIDYVKFQLNLFRGEINFEIDVAVNRLYEVLYFIDDIQNLSLNTDSLAVLYASIKKNEVVLGSEIDFIEHVKNNLDLKIQKLINSTAHHFDVLGETIKLISISDYEYGLQIAEKLNTRVRRERAIFEVFVGYLENPIENIDLGIVDKISSKLNSNLIKANLLIYLLNHLLTNYEKCNIELEKILDYMKTIDKFFHNERKITGYLLVYEIINKKYKIQTHNEELLKRFLNAIEILDSNWDKIILSYLITSIVAKYDFENGKRLFLEAEKYKKVSWIQSPARALAYKYSLKLAIQAYSGLFYGNNDIENDFEVLEKMILELPSNKHRIELWTYLATFAHLNRKFDLREKVINIHIKPILNSIKDVGKKFECIVECGHILYLSHNISGLEFINSLPYEYKQDALVNVIEFILSQKLPEDPFVDFENHISKVKYEDIIDVLDLMKGISTDNVIFRCVKDVVYAIVHSNLIKKPQSDILVSKLRHIIDEKLPDNENIVHEGYKILACGYLLQLDKKNAKERNWKELIAKIDLIPSQSDKAYTYAIMTEIIPDSYLEIRKGCIENSINLIDQIGSDIERIERYEDICKIIYKINPALCKDKMKQVIELSKTISNTNIFSTIRDMIDFIYKYDPSLAKGLIEITENNNENLNDLLTDHFELLKMKEKIVNDKISEYDPNNNASDFARSTWQLYGYLKVGKAFHRKVENTIIWLNYAFDIPFSESYSLFACFIENANRRLQSTKEAKSILRQIFESILLNLRILRSITDKTTQKVINYNKLLIEEKSNVIVIKSGQRELFMQSLNDWLLDNVSDTIKICDPFFDASELWILKNIISANPKCVVKILTSAGNRDINLNERIKDIYLNAWTSISEQEAPPTLITIVYTKHTKKSPFHDRWILSDNLGLRLGGSLNGMGIGKDSEMSFLSKEEVQKISDEIVDNYLNITEYYYNSEKLEYSKFNL